MNVNFIVSYKQPVGSNIAKKYTSKIYYCIISSTKLKFLIGILINIPKSIKKQPNVAQKL